MKHAKLFLLLPLLAVVACDPITPNQPNDPKDTTKTEETVIPSSFPKKHLIEHFTGEGCGYCPMGMQYLQEFVGTDTNFVWVSHHAGYQDDQFTIKGSKTIAGKLRVDGAPAMAIDRTPLSYTYMDEETGKEVTETGTVFHPGYLPDLTSELEKTTYASINITHTYDAATKDMNITVQGLVADTTVENLTLTLLVKENNLIGEQADYVNSWEGWEEFRHNKVARAFITEPMGIEIPVKDQKYGISYQFALEDGWNPDNCVLVAYITEKSGKPVINANQVPVLKGNGGEDALFEGIKAVEVPATYPETTAAPTPLTFASAGLYETGTDGLYVLQAISTQSFTVGTYTALPLVSLYIVSSQLAPGTFPINTTMADNTVVAGQRFDDEFVLDGSMLYLCESSYLQAGYIMPFFQWLLVDGTLTLNSDLSFTVNATTLAGYSVEMTGALQTNAPAKKAAKKHISTAKTPLVPFNLPADVTFK